MLCTTVSFLALVIVFFQCKCATYKLPCNGEVCKCSGFQNELV